MLPFFYWNGKQVHLPQKDIPTPTQNNYAKISKQAQLEVPHSEIQVELDWQPNW